MLNEDSKNDEDAADILAIDLKSVTSSENNALTLEELLRDECSYLHIFSCYNDPPADDGHFVVSEGDDISYLGNLIGKSNRLESISLWHMPLNDSFRDGLAVNKSIQELTILEDLGEEGIRCLAPFFRNTDTLTEIRFSADSTSCESMKSFALLLSQCQTPSLKRIYLEEIELSDNEYTVFARALSTQPQLEELNLTNLYLNGFRDDNDSFLGHITLGATMKNWKSPCLKVLDLESSDNSALLPLLVDDDGMMALVEGMENCNNLERLNLAGHNTITEVGLRAISSLFQSKKFLSSINLRDMNITDDFMTLLAPGLASLTLLKKLDLSNNNIGDEGLQALAVAHPDYYHLEELLLWNNATFTAAGLISLSIVLKTVSRLEYLNLSNNSIDDEGLQAFITGMRGQYPSDLSFNSISSGMRSLAASKMSTLRRLELCGNNVAFNDEAMEALIEAMESLCNLECLALNRITSSGLSILATVFRSESCSLQELDLCETRIGDSGAIALANGLRGNQSLTEVCFDHRSLTDVGWSAFERLLCDTPSVNNTYSSNHTLEIIGNHYQSVIPFSIEALLDLNRQKDEGVNVPMCKILMSHSDFDLLPLLQWKLKLLPFILMWFERAQSSRPTRPRIALKGRKLSAMFQFVSGSSHAVVEGFVHRKKQRNVDSSSGKRKFNQ